MLHVFLGTDTKKVRAAYTKLKEASSGTFIRMTSEEFAPDAARDVVQHSDMFGSTYTVVFDGVLQDPASKEMLLGLVPLFKNSSHTIVIVDEKIDAAAKKTLRKYADTLEEHDEKKAPAERGDFTLANAFSQKKRAQAWVAYRKAILSGEAPEALHGMLFWKVKQMVNGHSSFTPEEIRLLLKDLAELPGRVRKRNGTLEEALEHFILAQ